MNGTVRVNCDMGERGPDHPVDLELLRWIDVANVACGGHAGDEASARRFSELAGERGIRVTAHLSYPDREGFGRQTMSIPPAELLESLERQGALLPEVKTVKFHGALYNDSCSGAELARLLAQWLKERGYAAVLTMPRSALAAECEALGLEVYAEAFAERRYQIERHSGLLSLMSRRDPRASIEELHEAVAQVRRIVERGEVEAWVEDGAGGTSEWRTVPLQARTICIHSDSLIALPLARALSEMLRV